MKTDKTINPNLRLVIRPDPDSENPRNWGGNTHMVCWHHRYNLGDKHEFKSPEEFHSWRKKTRVVWAPVYMYEHSGIAFDIEGFSCPWDSGQLGYIYMYRRDIPRPFRDTKEHRQEYADSVFIAELSVYEQYINGDVYYYILYEKCPTCGAHTEALHSCDGFYGRDPKTNGMRDHLEEYRDQIDWDKVEHEY